MVDLIIWCNENAGLLTAVQTLFTSIIGVLAVLIAIMAYREPYARRLHIDWALDIDESREETPGKVNFIMNLYITNTGHVPIRIESAEADEFFSKKKKRLLGVSYYSALSGESAIILPDERKRFDISFCELDEIYTSSEVNSRIRIKVETRDKIFTQWAEWIFG